MTPMEQAAEMAGKGIVSWVVEKHLDVEIEQVNMLVHFRDSSGATHALGVTLGAESVLNNRQAEVRQIAAPFTGNN